MMGHVQDESGEGDALAQASIVEISRLDLREGDTLVVMPRSGMLFSMADSERLKIQVEERIRLVLPHLNIGVMVFRTPVDLTVLRPERE